MAEHYSDPLPIQRLSERHPGITEAISAYYHEGAAICFARHFVSPTVVEVTSVFQGENRVAAAESQLGLVAVGRSYKGSGADYMIKEAASLPTDREIELYDLYEDAFRFEISGVDAGYPSTISARLDRKIQQTRYGNRSEPAIAGIVGFKLRVVRLAEVNP